MTSSKDMGPLSKGEMLRAKLFGHGLPAILEVDDEAGPQQEQPSSEEPAQQASRSKAEDKTG